MERFTWEHLPETTHRAFEREFGKVHTTSTTPAGLTVGVAARVETADTTVFVKAVPRRSPAFLDYARERAVGQAIATTVPAPRLLWSHQDSWLTLVFEYIPGRQVDLSRDADAVMAALRTMREPLRSSPVAELRPITHKLDVFLAGARETVVSELQLLDHRDSYRVVLDDADLADFQGTALVHADPAASNLIHDGTSVWVVDWALSSVGAPWVDVALLIPPLIAAGYSPPNAQAWAEEHPDWAEAPTRAVDLLAVTRMLFLLGKIHAGPSWLAHGRRKALPAHQAWARYRLGV
ncbi:phosphotransferase [Lipingzhangella sp. LS1_29]|uniref:Phosphotransferase n=1 Tax=Lipingzhangella rawalii TaxID=2055835 RepID=A0ABU2H255_9ACTN|nr:phosphotransferase [Lipingzhangella rawalii]MDS1268714.1 phosphotransferase [Lipingzhangella rawalii]